MPDTSQLLQHIQHYQKSLQRYTQSGNEDKMLHCILKLYKMPITVSHLEETGIGRTVNSLRKVVGEVGDAAKSLVNKWKEMVSGNEDYKESVNSNANDESNKRDSRRVTESNSSHNSDKHKINGVKERDSKYKSSRDEKSISDSKFKSSSNSEHRRTKKDSSDSENEYSPLEINSTDSDYQSSSKSSSGRSDSSSENENQSKRSDDTDRKSSQKSSKHIEKSKEESSREKYNSSKDRHGSHSEKEKVKKSDSSSHSDSSKSHKHHSNSSDKKHSDSAKVSNSKRKHDETSSDEEPPKKSSKKSSHDSHSKSTSSHKYKESHREHKESENKKESKSDKKESKSSSHDKTEKSDKKQSDSHKTDSAKLDDKSKKSSSKYDKNASSTSSSSKDKTKSSKHSSKSSTTNSHSNSSSKKILTDVNIWSESGTSFAEALGMLEPPKVSKKVQKIPEPKPEKIVEKSEKSSKSPVEKPSKSDKIEVVVPLPPPIQKMDLDIGSLLPAITPYYKPVTNPFQENCFARNKSLNDDEALSLVMSQKNQRTKVYSGNKSLYTTVPSLFDMSIRVLQDNIDALEYTGGVPYAILKPVIDKATPEQLFMLEHHNPYLIEDTDDLWQFHCMKQFKSKKRQELESWREMYMRCLDEREAKLKLLTENIKLAQDKSTPVRQTKLAYIDSVVKPPRDVLRKQAKSGIDKKPVITPTARLNSVATAGAAGQAVVPNPVRASSSGTSAAAKPKKAPLMQKTLAFIKKGSRFRR